MGHIHQYIIKTKNKSSVIEQMLQPSKKNQETMPKRCGKRNSNRDIPFAGELGTERQPEALNNSAKKRAKKTVDLLKDRQG